MKKKKKDKTKGSKQPAKKKRLVFQILSFFVDFRRHQSYNNLLLSWQTCPFFCLSFLIYFSFLIVFLALHAIWYCEIF